MNTRILYPMPPDFPEVARMMPKQHIARHYGRLVGTVERWFREAGLEPIKFRRPTSMPDDFAETATVMHFSALARHYGKSTKTIDSWLKRIGIRAAEWVPSYDQVEARKRHAAALARRRWKNSGPKPAAIPRDTSIEGMAADTLRPLAPTYRCNERGRLDPKGTHWRFGNIILTPDELLERAAAKGWRLAA